MPIKSHRNYGVYRSIKEDLRYGLLELEDKIFVYKDNKVIFGYEAYDELNTENLEIITVQELLDFISKNQ